MVHCTTALKLALCEIKESLCSEKTKTESPICGYDINVECHMRHITEHHPITSIFVVNENGESVAAEDVLIEERSASYSNSRIIEKLRKVKNHCNKSVRVVRDCGHKSRPIACLKIFAIMTGRATLPKCNQAITIY